MGGSHENPFHLLGSVLQWVDPARRVQPEERVSHELLQKALAEMLAQGTEYNFQATYETEGN